ncbi:hypothetical protein ACFVX9_30480 [Kitasatospora sp. NPDC058243]
MPGDEAAGLGLLAYGVGRLGWLLGAAVWVEGEEGGPKAGAEEGAGQDR